MRLSSVITIKMEIINHFFIHFVLAILYSAKTIHSVPPNYCLLPLNTSDCKLTPTPVFTYYKPGSRCEIEMWRGCPTKNKFETQYHCVDLCIFRAEGPRDINNKNDVDLASIELEKDDVILEPGDDDVILEHILEPGDDDVILEPGDECDAALNTDRCNNTEHTVYTHHNGKCVQAIWRGCPTRNKFHNEASCLLTCIESTVHKIQAWTEEKEDEARKEEDVDDNYEDENVENDNEKKEDISKDSAKALNNPKISQWENDLNGLMNSEAEDLNQIVDFITDEEEKQSMKHVTTNIFNNGTKIEEIKQSTLDDATEPYSTKNTDIDDLKGIDNGYTDIDTNSSEKYKNWMLVQDNSTRGCSCPTTIHDSSMETTSSTDKQRYHDDSPLPDVEILREPNICECP